MSVIVAVFSLLLIIFLWWGPTVWAAKRYNTTPDANPLLMWPALFSGLSILCVLVVAAIDRDPDTALGFVLTLVLPPTVLFLLYQPFVATLLAPVGAVALIVFALVRATRLWAPLMAVIAMAVAVPLGADAYYDRQMCESAARHGLTGLERPPFWHNLTRTKMGLEPYAIAFRDGELWDWGYTNERFVRYGGTLPEWADMSGFEPLVCPANGNT